MKKFVHQKKIKHRSYISTDELEVKFNFKLKTPTLILLEKGELSEKHEGVLTCDQLKLKIKNQP
jgi:hypothetical protein